MARSKSWSVKGIAPETRDTARDAAQAAGMPIGSWIDNAILKAARGELPGIPTSSIPAPATQGTTPAEPPEPIETFAPATPASPETPVPAETGEPSAEPSSGQGPGPAPGPAPAHPDLRAIESDARAADIRPRPLAAPPGYHDSDRTAGRPGKARYVAVGAILVAMLSGGVWYLLQQNQATAPPGPVATSEPAAPTQGTPPAATGDSAPATGTPAAPADTTAAPEPASVREIIAKAGEGDAKAQFNLGMLHLSGRYVAKDPAEAAKWFEKAAVQGLANAQFNLGVLYENGEGVAQNSRLAFFWYQSAAEQGFPRAEHNLATAYASGRGVPRNDAKAVEWFTKAADSGLAESQYSLGLVYERGLGKIAPDLKAARTWFASAAAQGDKDAQEHLAAIDKKLGASAAASAAEPAKAPAPPAAAAPADNRPLNRTEIAELQRLLNGLNFDAGTPDGRMGPKTASAIRLYQKFAGLSETGTPTRPLLEDLRAVSQTMKSGG